jgi:DNA-binding NtrC family response regulator
MDFHMNHRNVIPFDGREQSSFRGVPGGWAAAPPRAAIGRLDSNAAIDAPLEPFPDVATREGVNEGFPGSIGSSAALMEVFDQVPALAAAQPEPVTLEDVERTHIRRTLDATNWVVSGPAGAASLLGMKRSTLVSKIQRMGIRKRGYLQ